MSKLSKLFKLKNYLSVEEVSTTDLYGFVLDRHLSISVQFDCIFQMAQGYLTRIEDTPQFANEQNSYRYGSGKILSFEDHHPMQSEGVWDLTLFGREFIDIDRLHSELKSTQQWNMPPANAAILQKTTFRGDVIYAKLMEASKDQFVEEKPFRPYPEALEMLKKPKPLIVDSQSLSSYLHHLVFRREELERFIRAVESECLKDNELQKLEKEPKPLASKRENSYQKLLLWLFKKQNYDLKSRDATSKIMRKLQEENISISEKTIRSIIKQLAELQM